VVLEWSTLATQWQHRQGFGRGATIVGSTEEARASHVRYPAAGLPRLVPKATDQWLDSTWH